MNGQCAKRLRNAAEAKSLALGMPVREAFKTIYASYKKLPFHRRSIKTTGGISIDSHSARLKRRHSLEK